VRERERERERDDDDDDDDETYAPPVSDISFDMKKKTL